MRSVQIEASAQSQRGSRASDPCLALAGTAGPLACSSPFKSAFRFLPPFPRAGFASRPSRGSRRIGTMKDCDSRRPHPKTAGLSASSASPSRRSDLNHVSRPKVALSFASAPSAVPGFALPSQARHRLPPNQVRHPTDRQFASSCFSPRLATTRLLSTSGPANSPGVDFHHADKASSRTHDRRRRPSLCDAVRAIHAQGAAKPYQAMTRAPTPAAEAVPRVRRPLSHRGVVSTMTGNHLFDECPALARPAG